MSNNYLHKAGVLQLHLNKLQNILNTNTNVQSHLNSKSLEDDTSLITYTYNINDTYFHCCFNNKT